MEAFAPGIPHPMFHGREIWKEGGHHLDTHMLTREERAFHPWPWEEEVISAAEYRRSLQSLKRFLEEAEVSQLHTVEDVSAVASLVGHDVRALAVANGQKIEKRMAEPEPGASEPLGRIEREYVFIKGIGDREVVVTASNGYTFISERRRVGFGFHGYYHELLRVSLPSDRDIAIGEKPIGNEQSIYAIDLREASIREYHPAKEPKNVAIQQGFTHVLKDALRDIVSGLI